MCVPNPERKKHLKSGPVRRRRRITITMEDRRRLPLSPLTTPDYVGNNGGGEFCSGGGTSPSPLDRGGGGCCYTNGLLVAESSGANSSCGGSFEHSPDGPEPPPPPVDEDNDFIDDDDDEDGMNDDDEVRLVAVQQTTTSSVAAAVKRLSGSNFGGGESGRSPIERSPSGEPGAASVAPAGMMMHKRETIVSVDSVGGSASCSTRTATARVNFAPGSVSTPREVCTLCTTFVSMMFLRIIRMCYSYRNCHL